VFKGILIAVTLFIGFEAAAAIAEETPNPHRSVPIAVLSTVAIATVFYVLMGYAVMIGFGSDAIAKGAAAADPDALGTLAKHYDGWFLRGWIDLVVITDAISLSVAFTVSATRGVFALARDGLLPRFLATTSSHDTPLGGNLVSFVFSVGFLAWASVVHYGAGFGLPDTLAAFQILSLAGSFMIELIYVFLALGAFVLIFGSEPRSKWWWQLPVVVIALLTPLAAYKGSLWPWPPDPINRGIYFAIAGGVIALVWAIGLQVLKPDRVRNAAAYATRIEDAAPAAPVDLGL
jgi:amino acid transporter